MDSNGGKNNETICNLRSIQEIPAQYRCLFGGYPYFNIVQSQVFQDVLHSDKSVVVSAPTGSGKTVIFELAVLKLLLENESKQTTNNFKIIYISPIKALCEERLVDWHRKFSKFGLSCISVTGDSDYFDFSSLLNHNFIVTTPEKWDSITRKWRDNVKLVQLIKLFLIDEVHLLNDDNRGPTLEVIVSRMKTIENAINAKENIRFIAVSATVPNIEDVSSWIGKNSIHFKFSDDKRPVPLKKIVIGYNFDIKNGTFFKFDISLNYRLQNLLLQYSQGKPTLIFCSTRKSVEMTAKHIVQNLTINLNAEQKQKLLDTANTIQDSKARETVTHGVGYHHAGMMPETKHAIEALFRNSDLPILVTTSTLAMGVNLPAHLVIVKSTKCYSTKGFEDYSETSIMQMIGRAGRPQFDTSGTAIILTTTHDKKKFERMVGGSQPIESNLHKHLNEHLNAEVVLGTIKDLDVAMRWLSSTFLYIRARKNPKYYGFSTGLTEDQIDRKLLEMCQIQLNKLTKAGMLTMDQNIIITPTETGIIMAKYYIAFDTMKLFTKVNGWEVLQQILGMVSQCHEFSEMYLRTDDKRCLNCLNRNKSNKTIRFPLNGKIKTLDMKINCIIQAVFGCLDIWDQSVLADSKKIMRNGERIVKCLIEYLGTRPTCYSALLNSIILAKCFRASIWENSPYVSKQLKGIGTVLSNQLVNAGKTSFDKILEMNPREIELILKKKSPFGNRILDEVRHIPRYRMTLEKIENGKSLRLTLQLQNRVDIEKTMTGKDYSIMTLLVGDNNNEILLYEQYTHSYMLENADVVKTIELQNLEVLEEVSAHFLSEQWVGIDCNCTVVFSKVSADSKQVDNEKKKDTSYMQMFMDMYMKVKKNIMEPQDKNGGKTKPAISSPKKPKSKEKKTKGEKDKGIQRTISQFLSPKNQQEVVDGNKENQGNSNEEQEVAHAESENKIKIYQNVLLKKGNSPKIIKPKLKLFESADIMFEDELFDHLDQLSKENSAAKTTDEDLKNKNTPKNKLDVYIDISGEDLERNQWGTSPKCDQQENTIDIDNYNTHIVEETKTIPDQAKDNPKENLFADFVYDYFDDNSYPEFDDNVQQKPNECVTQANNNKNIVSNSTYPKIDNFQDIFNISQKYGVSCPRPNKPVSSTSCKRKLPLHPAMEFEDNLFKEENEKPNLQDYRFAGRRKLLHHTEVTPDSTVNTLRCGNILSPKKKPKNSHNSFPYENNDSNRKSITWSSPLVYSPPAKYSPNIKQSQTKPNYFFELETKNQNNFNQSLTAESLNQGFSSSMRNKNVWPPVSKPKLRKMGTQFPLGDKEYESEDNHDTSTNSLNNTDDYSDVCSNSFMENFSLQKPQLKSPSSSLKTRSRASDYYSRIVAQSQKDFENVPKEAFRITQKPLEFRPNKINKMAEKPVNEEAAGVPEEQQDQGPSVEYEDLQYAYQYYPRHIADEMAGRPLRRPVHTDVPTFCCSVNHVPAPNPQMPVPPVYDPFLNEPFTQSNYSYRSNGYQNLMPVETCPVNQQLFSRGSPGLSSYYGESYNLNRPAEVYRGRSFWTRRFDGSWERIPNDLQRGFYHDMSHVNNTTVIPTPPGMQMPIVQPPGFFNYQMSADSRRYMLDRFFYSIDREEDEENNPPSNNQNQF